MIKHEISIRNVHFKPLTVLATALALLMLQVPMARAETDAQSTDFMKWGLSLGVFVTQTDSQTKLNGSTDEGSDVDMESDLGLKNSDSVFRVDGYYRFTEKHRVDFSYFDLSRDASKRIQKDIEWQDEIYPVDTTVKASVDMTIYKIAYTYSFLQRDKGYIGASIGLYVADLGVGLSADSLKLGANSGVTAPLPVLGLRGEYYLSDKWIVRASGEIFAFEYGDFSGSLNDIYLGVDYQLFKNTAVGVGYNRVDFNLDVSKPRFDGSLDWQYSGGLVFVKFNF